MGFLALILAVCAGIGAAVNRWWAVPIPPLAIVAYVLGRREGWWGCCGVGEGWWAGMIVLAVLAAAGFAAGVALRRARSQT